MASSTRADGKKSILADPIKRAILADVLVAVGRIIENVGESLNGVEPQAEEKGENDGL